MFVKISDEKIMNFKNVESVFIEETENIYALMLEKNDGTKKVILTSPKERDAFQRYLSKRKVYQMFTIIMAQLKFENLLEDNIAELISDYEDDEEYFADELESMSNKMRSFTTDKNVIDATIDKEIKEEAECLWKDLQNLLYLE